MVKIKYISNPDKIQSNLRVLIKILVVDKNYHEIKNEILRDYTDEF